MRFDPPFFPQYQEEETGIAFPKTLLQNVVWRSLTSQKVSQKKNKPPATEPFAK